MPGIKEEEGDDEPEEVGRGQGDDKRVEDLVFDDVGDGELVGVDFCLDGFYGYEDRGEH